MNLTQMCEHAMPIPLHSTLDDWSGNMGGVKHTYISQNAPEGTRYAHPYAQELSEWCGYHFHGTQNKQRGCGWKLVRSTMAISGSGDHTFRAAGPACDS